MTTTKQSELIAEEMGEDCLEALKSGGNWEWKPDSAEGCDPFCYVDHDRDGTPHFSEVFYVRGFEVAGGVMFDNVWEVSPDSGWDFLEAHEVDAEDYEEWLEEYGYEAQQASWVPYYEHALKTGEDPLGVFLGAPRVHKQKWCAKITQGDGRPVLAGAHRKSLAYIARVAISDPKRLPESVRQYLNLDDRGNLLDFISIDEIKGENVDRLERVADGIVVVFEVDEPIGPEITREQIKARAEQELGRGEIDDSEENPRWEPL